MLSKQLSQIVIIPNFILVVPINDVMFVCFNVEFIFDSVSLPNYFFDEGSYVLLIILSVKETSMVLGELSEV